MSNSNLPPEKVKVWVTETKEYECTLTLDPESDEYDEIVLQQNTDAVKKYCTESTLQEHEQEITEVEWID